MLFRSGPLLLQVAIFCSPPHWMHLPHLVKAWGNMAYTLVWQRLDIKACGRPSHPSAAYLLGLESLGVAWLKDQGPALIVLAIVKAIRSSREERLRLITCVGMRMLIHTCVKPRAHSLNGRMR